ncbi:glycoside hydrolase family 3 protein [Blautia difficilis]|uniref:Glycoside hydrolase family 3 C-terminal domain-containing protein n=1 Tax=Blautia difficilis TaxID=2763027 RepID=A0ABR7IE93_9FIRM|nr:glycoside hydrolase family 3 protein [Blautia difficilis]MBC5778314.1 glycoside hydrolase family 3 C-terminal domain-containing protein [Blautia difficilis]
MKNYKLDLERYAVLARQATAEGCVLLENEGQSLPLREGERVAVFGRMAFHYYKSGLGSGGLVNTRYVVGILDALKDCKEIRLDEKLMGIYEDWIRENPFDEGQGWGRVPWCQKEMEVTDEMLGCARDNDVSLVIIGRTAGEDQDNNAGPGSYCLTETEEDMIRRVCQVSKRTVVVLNVGNIIDMSWVKKYHPQAVLYAWQGGQEGGNGVADVLTGKVCACGKLTDTIAQSIEDYPSTENFGDPFKNYYKEDIYVGYRYFETFAKDKVLYPFGYGLSYTSFEIKAEILKNSEEELTVAAEVVNTGAVKGKEVVQVYAKVPQGKLGNPARRLIGFAKTGELKPGEKEEVVIVIPKYDFTSYDDSGVTGHKSCYVLEEGIYEIFVGSDVRSAESAGCYKEKFRVVEKLQEAYAPVEKFSRMKAVLMPDGSYQAVTEEVPVRTVDSQERRKQNLPETLAYTGDKGYKLVDVLDGKVSMENFVAQIREEDLIAMFRGEGMCSPKVTPGTAAAFGGVTESMKALGIPVGCCADGPSGIRMDCGTKAFSLPNGTALGCTFNTELVGDLYEMTGKELRLNKIDSLLGPGMNIHRNPLNGRNFEYISEDPLLTGRICAAQVKAMAKSGIGSTIKHFCGNNQEVGRSTSDSVMSERCLREIYLKGFEMAVREGGARSVMTTYGSVNGLWTAGSYDLCTTILRKEWGFEGIVMTDWWAKSNYEGHQAEVQVKAPMVAAQNDIYMVVSDAKANPEKDDVEEMLHAGKITLGELQRNAANILGFLLKSPSILLLTDRICAEELEAMNTKEADDVDAGDLIAITSDPETQEMVVDGSLLHPAKGNTDILAVTNDYMGEFTVKFVLRSELGELAQLPISVFMDNIHKMTVSVQGTNGKWVEESRLFDMPFGHNHYIKLYYGADNLEIKEILFIPNR